MLRLATAAVKPYVKHRKREPEGVHGQLEGCNRKLRPKAAVAKVLPPPSLISASENQPITLVDFIDESALYYRKILNWMGWIKSK